MLSTFVYANEPQKVTSCVKVVNNHSKFLFQAKFESTDAFDTWHSGSIIHKGEICNSHTYQYGPKTLSVKVNADEPKVYFELDNTCIAHGVYVESLKAIIVKHKQSMLADVNWHFVLTEKSHTPDLATFTVSCSYRNN